MNATSTPTVTSPSIACRPPYRRIPAVANADISSTAGKYDAFR